MKSYLLILLFFVTGFFYSQNKAIKELEEWKFFKGENTNAYLLNFDDSEWESVQIPHDWAIYGPFDKEVDKQTVKIEQNNEEVATEKTGRTGALPFIGVGWYRTSLDILESEEGKKLLLTFDGAMSNAQVYINGEKIGGRPYGYSYFYFDVSEKLKPGQTNSLAVRLENSPRSSRWYPGAGLYRKVRLITKDPVSFKHWGHTITTPFIGDSKARVNVISEVEGSDVCVKTTIKDSEGNMIAENSNCERFGDEIEQNIGVENPKLWSPENPYLYTANIQLLQDGKVMDEKNINFGIRSIEYTSEGFKLNGKTTKFKGVCLHHDLGPLGTAVNTSALRRQMKILKDLGCNAIRSAHNMPSFEQLQLADEMGFMFIAESFDEWKKPKVENGYNLYFEDWAEKDVQNLVRATKNHPSIVMWSAGNEVPDQWGSDGVKRLHRLQDVFHEEDPTRPVTVGMDQVKAVMESGFGAVLDVPGLNYRVHLYEEAHDRFPQGYILGSETGSTVSSRGIYKFPVKSGPDIFHPDLQSSSYDLEYCNWSNIPEDDFEQQDDHDWVLGEFVWTGFDYLGEPTPYDNYWPSRSSYFGMVDLAGIPKDRYYLYRSRWNTEEETLHVLPHWNWEEREGEITPVFVYTSYDSAELFVNGKSQGIQKKNMNSKLERYRLMWNNVRYEPGKIRVVAYDDNGKPAMEKEIVTAGKPHHLKLEADRTQLKANGEDISFVTVSVVDKNGNLCPRATNELSFRVNGAGEYRAACNGDPTSLELFHEPKMKAFSGKLVVLVKSKKSAGNIQLKVNGKNLRSEQLTLESL